MLCSWIFCCAVGTVIVEQEEREGGYTILEGVTRRGARHWPGLCWRRAESPLWLSRTAVAVAHAILEFDIWIQGKGRATFFEHRLANGHMCICLADGVKHSWRMKISIC